MILEVPSQKLTLYKAVDKSDSDKVVRKVQDAAKMAFADGVRPGGYKRCYLSLASRNNPPKACHA